MGRGWIGKREEGEEGRGGEWGVGGWRVDAEEGSEWRAVGGRGGMEG